MPKYEGVVYDQRIALKIPTDLDRRLHDYAKEKEKSISTLIRKWIMKGIEENKD